jgi:tryptophan 7-halogenase
MKTVAILGSGTAGLVSISHLLAWLPSDWKVSLIHDPKIPILGIGESTSTQIPHSLFHGTGFNLLEIDNYLDSTIKHGVKYVNWRKNEIFTKIPPPYYAMHFNNFKLKDFCITKFRNLWKDKFIEICGTVTVIENLPNFVKITCDDKTFYYDYLIDCRGYPTTYEDYEIVKTIPVNHCLVHTINQPGDWSFTYHVAHPNGWMFGIPLKTRQGWGYLYNDTITEKKQAVDNLREILNTDVDENKLREFSFKNYRSKKFIDNRIIKNGNRALFYEPLEALSGWFYDAVIRTFFDLAVSNNIDEASANQKLQSYAVDYELFICYMYHKGSVFDSDFWKYAKKKCQARLENSERFQRNVEFLKHISADLYNNVSTIMPFSYDVWKKIDIDFDFNYFSRI